MSGNYLPRNTLVESLGHAMLKLSGWKIEGQLPALDKFVVIGAHHTSNWDFVLMLAIAWQLGIEVHWLGKKSLFRGWRGPIMRALGGIAVGVGSPPLRLEAFDAFDCQVVTGQLFDGFKHFLFVLL